MFSIMCITILGYVPNHGANAHCKRTGGAITTLVIILLMKVRIIISAERICLTMVGMRFVMEVCS